MVLPEIKEIEQRRIKMDFTIRLFVNTINNLGGKGEKDQLSPAWLNQVERGKIPNPSYFKIKSCPLHLFPIFTIIFLHF